MRAPGVSLVMVGDELLDRRVTDTNSRWLMEALADDGVEVCAVFVVPDDVAAIARVLRGAVDSSSAVVVTGGLGPTPDDLTREALARVVGEELVLDPQLLSQIQERYRRRGRDMPAANRRQALRTPSGTPLPNAWGTAPGLAHAVNGVPIVLLPGVPRELRGMWPQAPRDLVLKAVPRRRLAQVRLRTAGLGESDLADQVDAALQPRRSGTDVAFCVTRFGVDLLVRSESSHALDEAVGRLRRDLGSLVYAQGGLELPDLVVAALRQAGQTVAVAESCTGGLLGAALTSVPGASEVFAGGILAYSDEIKTTLLDVDPGDLTRHGAVSEEVARSMARGARARFGADWAAAITGIAGPGGGTAQKPVGTVWIALEGPGVRQSRRLHLPGDREQNRRWSMARALDLLRLALQEIQAP